MTLLNRESLEKSNQGILTYEKGYKNLLVSFGGINQGLGVPVFEFFNSIESLKCDKIFLRDFSQTWYQKGVDETINDINAIKVFIKTKLETNKYKRIVFLGNSMGGYAAILFGTLLNVNNIISFAPQTFIDKKNRFLFWDRRWKKQINNMHSNTKKSTEYFDITEYLIKNKNYNSKINIYYSDNHRLDKLHATRLEKLNGVTLHPYSEGGHGVVKTLRDSGELHTILINAFK